MPRMAAALMILAIGLVPASSAAAACAATDTLGLDPTYSVPRDSMPPAFLGMAIGQTFYAPDTLLSSFTVWRLVDPGVPATLVRLWILQADADGLFFNHPAFYEGPIQPFYGDVEPMEMRFTFDPPLVLPGKGWYFAAVQDPCSLFFELYTSYVDLVPGHWGRTARSNLSGCGLHGFDGACPTCDLCFRAVFCRDAVDPVRSKSWGQLKVLYR